MIAIFYLSPRSLVMAYMLSQLEGAKPVRFDPANRFYFDEVRDTRELAYDSIYSDYRERIGGMDFLEDAKLYDVISREIFWGLRHRSRDNASLILQVLGQIQESGSKEYLSESSPEAREMKLRVRKVLSEFNRALRFVRFDRFNSPALSIAKATFDNDIADMVLRAEAMRSPGNIGVIFDDAVVLILLSGELFSAKRKRVPVTPDRKNFNHFWGGLPESGRSILTRDEIHAITEVPEIVLAPEDSEAARGTGEESASLDDFV